MRRRSARRRSGRSRSTTAASRRGSDKYGDLDQATLALAKANQFSQSAQLQHNYDQGVEALKKQLAAPNALHSGDLGYGLDQAEYRRGASAYDLGRQYGDAATNILNQYVNAVNSRATAARPARSRLRRRTSTTTRRIALSAARQRTSTRRPPRSGDSLFTALLTGRSTRPAGSRSRRLPRLRCPTISPTRLALRGRRRLPVRPRATEGSSSRNPRL
jgi:hypothetical protein